MDEPHLNTSPPWGWNAKFIVSLTIIGCIAFLLLKVQNLLGPLLVGFTLTYLFYPLAGVLHRWVHIPWRIAVTLIYLLIITILIGLLTLGGLALFDQIQSLVNFLQQAVVSLPETLNNLSKQTFVIGPYTFQLARLDWTAVSNQIIGAVQPLLGRITSVLGIVASSAANLVAWTAFVLLVSYFFLVETDGSPGKILHIRVPGYESDFNRLGVELGRVWNAFLRGQLIITVLTILIYSVMLGAWGLRFYVGLALMAGLAKFIPYIGPLIAWTTYFLVAAFQPNPPLGLTPAAYGGLVVVSAMLVDNIFDNLVTPRVMAQALKVHPAAVLLAALIGASILGLVGVVLAAPVLATFKLFFTYATRKLFDLDPWEGEDLAHRAPPETPPILKLLKRLRTIVVKKNPSQVK